MRQLLALLLLVTLAACASRISKQGATTRRAVADAGLAQLGVPYRYGGADRSGFDCSGFVQYAFAQAGVELPRSTAEQMKVGAKIAYSDARTGDLLFYRFTDRRRSSLHVAIYLGDDWIVHAPATGKQVTKTRSDEKPWSARFVGAVRVLP